MMIPTPSDSAAASASSPSRKAAPALLHLALLAAAVWTASMADGTRVPSLSKEKAAALKESVDEAMRSGIHPAALKGVRRLLLSSPDNQQYLSMEAELLGKAGDFQGEAADWEAFVTVAPFPTDACPHLGRAYANGGLPEKAFEAHARCHAMSPENSDMRLFYAQALMFRGRHAESEQQYRAILKESPGYVDAKIGLSRLCMGDGRAEEAAKLLAESLASHPRHPDALLAQSMLDESRGDRASAKKRLRLAAQVSPSYGDVYRRLASLLEEDKEFDEALAVYRALAAIEPEDPKPRARAAALEARGAK